MELENLRTGEGKLRRRHIFNNYQTKILKKQAFREKFFVFGILMMPILLNRVVIIFCIIKTWIASSNPLISLHSNYHIKEV